MCLSVEWLILPLSPHLRLPLLSAEVVENVWRLLPRSITRLPVEIERVVRLQHFNSRPRR